MKSWCELDQKALQIGKYLKAYSSRIALLIIMLCLLGGCSSGLSNETTYPQRPIKLIVPFGAGGGSDTFARILAKAIEENELLPQPLVIINVPGAGGTIGSRRLKNARPDGYTLMQLHEGILTSKYSGRVSYGPEAFDVIAGMGESTMVIAVGGNSEYETLTDLMQAATERPDEVIFSANIGAPSQFAGLMLEKVSPGAKFRYSQTGDGAKRFAGLQGGHTDASAFSLAEYIQFRPSGLRAIALLGKKRHPEANEVPTAIEQGYDVVSTNMQFWWTPKGTDPEKRKIIAQALNQAMQTEEAQQRFSQLKIDPVVLLSEDVEQELQQRSEKAAEVAPQIELDLPNFPYWIMMIILLLVLLFIFDPKRRSLFKQNSTAIAETTISPKVAVAASVLLVTALYVTVLQTSRLGYLASTMGYLLIMGWLLAAGNRRLLVTMFALSIVLSCGLFFLFTKVFVIDLP